MDFHNKKKKTPIAMFLKHGDRLEKCGYKMIWPITAFSNVA